MDRYSILDQSSTPPADHNPSLAASAHANEPVRFPGEDGGQSLSATARQDLDAALQLLVERAKYITGAMAATISLYADGELICRACTGTPKQKIGTRLQVESGLATESVRTRRILRCNDISVDVRTNSENCGKYGISSAMVMPLVRGPEVIGVFELLSGTTQAFEERDLSALARLGEMVETAMEDADTSKQTSPDAFFEEDLPAPEIGVVPLKLDPLEAEDVPAATPAPPAAKTGKQSESPLLERGTIGNCQACGFPVSGHRRFCVECAATKPKEVETSAELSAPSFMSDESAQPASKSGGLGAHGYVLATAFILIAAGAVVWMEFPQVQMWILQHVHLPH